MILTDYLLAARGSRLLGRIPWFASFFPDDMPARMRRLAHGEQFAPTDMQELMGATGLFWHFAGIASVLFTVGSFLVMAAFTHSHHAHVGWGWWVPAAAGIGGFAGAQTLFAYGIVRSRNVYDAVIAQRAGRWGNRVLAGMARPKPRDFWIAAVIGAGTFALIFTAFVTP